MVWLVNIAGIVLLIFIIWWFWLSRPDIVRSSSSIINIKVADGKYVPAYIEIAKGKEVTLRFQRTDPSPCAEIVRFDDLGVRMELPLNEPRDVHLCIESAGQYGFSCDMKMYQGTLIVQ
ncbi:MAG: cupredoxin domain-containing protein [Gammaproteobacteria bacterium]|nr:cupredoxin domain-containing protein [Gammaproteobacteria bacterium]